ncbi:PA2169 family four-helix-bundle protein [Caulobacter sp. CCNWLY153]|uniref:PA2169 family four-helix-bundle protein n=1 Tax=unclassified Caulobacter TaxID=2648921 RepID=UPI002FF38988
MAHTNENHIKLVNGLVEITIDSADGYEEAAKDAESSRFKTLFQARAQERRGIVSDLQAEVRRLGGTPDDDGSILAAAHRVFLNVRDALTKGDEAVVKTVEDGEDHIKAKYEKALGDVDIQPETRRAIEEAYAKVKAGHDQMRDIKHAQQAS